MLKMRSLSCLIVPSSERIQQDIKFNDRSWGSTNFLMLRYNLQINMKVLWHTQMTYEGFNHLLEKLAGLTWLKNHKCKCKFFNWKRKLEMRRWWKHFESFQDSIPRMCLSIFKLTELIMRSWESSQSVEQQTKCCCQPLPRIDNNSELCPPGVVLLLQNVLCLLFKVKCFVAINTWWELKAL